jgi:group I intron endonuclease
VNLCSLPSVYKITCVPTGKFYIGSSVNTKKRWKAHKFQLLKGTHDSRYMQNSWDKYGKDAFSFEQVLVCDPQNLLFYEQRCLDSLAPKFNTSPTAGSLLGHKHSDEAKQKFSVAQRNVRKKYNWKGQDLCLSDIADLENFEVSLLISRVLGLGKTPEEAIAMGQSRYKLYEYAGKA